MHSVVCMLSVLMCPHITYEINFYNVKLISLRYDGLFLFIVTFTYISCLPGLLKEGKSRQIKRPDW
jgi:hypothetical protein